MVTVVSSIARNGTQLFPVAAEHLWVKHVFATAAVAQGLHHAVDLTLEHFRQLQTRTNFQHVVALVIARDQFCIQNVRLTQKGTK